MRTTRPSIRPTRRGVELSNYRMGKRAARNATTRREAPKFSHRGLESAIFQCISAILCYIFRTRHRACGILVCPTFPRTSDPPRGRGAPIGGAAVRNAATCVLATRRRITTPSDMAIPGRNRLMGEITSAPALFSRGPSPRRRRIRGRRRPEPP